MVDATLTDHEVLDLRSTGQSYGAIAKAVGLPRARDAHDAFLRALRRQPAAEQAALRAAELRRVDDLARCLQHQPGVSEQQLTRKLQALARLRGSVLAD